MNATTHTSLGRTPSSVAARTRGARRATEYRYRRTPAGLRTGEALLLGLVLLLLLGLAFASRSPQPGAVDTASVRVAPGQTLWAIAGAHPVDGLSTAQTADLIAQLNGVDAASLRAGAVIRVPCGTSRDSAVASR